MPGGREVASDNLIKSFKVAEQERWRIIEEGEVTETAVGTRKLGEIHPTYLTLMRQYFKLRKPRRVHALVDTWMRYFAERRTSIHISTNQDNRINCMGVMATNDAGNFKGTQLESRLSNILLGFVNILVIIDASFSPFLFYQKQALELQ